MDKLKEKPCVKCKPGQRFELLSKEHMR